MQYVTDRLANWCLECLWPDWPNVRDEIPIGLWRVYGVGLNPLLVPGVAGLQMIYLVWYQKKIATEHGTGIVEHLRNAMTQRPMRRD